MHREWHQRTKCRPPVQCTVSLWYKNPNASCFWTIWYKNPKASCLISPTYLRPFRGLRKPGCHRRLTAIHQASWYLQTQNPQFWYSVHCREGGSQASCLDGSWLSIRRLAYSKIWGYDHNSNNNIKKNTKPANNRKLMKMLKCGNGLSEKLPCLGFSNLEC